jgi:hypothetical protein
MYHVHSFGSSNAAGPPPSPKEAGEAKAAPLSPPPAGDSTNWNVTVLIDQKPTTVTIVRVMYGRKLNVQPPPPVLTYLLHQTNTTGTGTETTPPPLPIITHYISTSGASGFDQIGTIEMMTAAADATLPALRTTWPTILTVPSRTDSMRDRLTAAAAWTDALLHVYDNDGNAATVAVRVRVALDYYAGASDGFAGYGTMCAIAAPHPQSPALCHADNERAGAVTTAAPVLTSPTCGGGGGTGNNGDDSVDIVKIVAIAVASAAIIALIVQHCRHATAAAAGSDGVNYQLSA